MDIEKILIYIVLAVIYYGFQFFAKKKNRQNQTTVVKSKPQTVHTAETFRPDPNLTEAKPYKPATILDVLDELKNKEAVFRRPDYKDERSLEEESYESRRQKPVIEDVNPYNSFKTVNVTPGSAGESERFEQFQLKEKKKHPVANLIRKRSSLRNSVIISEILKRRV